MAIQSLCTDDCVEDVIARYSEMVYRLAFSNVKSKADADDIFQEVFLRYISKKRTFENETHRKAWLIRVTVNCCKKLWSSAWFRTVEPLREPIPFEEQARPDLHELLLTLEQKYRTVIHLFYYEDLPVKQISAILKAKESTVRTWLTRARALLRENVKGDFFDE